MPSFNNAVRTGNRIEKYRTGFQLILATVLAVFLFPFALYALLRKRRYDMKTNGTVLNVSEMKCNTGCETHYTYKVNDKTYKGSAPGDLHVEGTTIELYYNPKIPSESGLQADEETFLTQKVAGRVMYVTHAKDEYKGCRRYMVKKETTTKHSGGSDTTTKDVPMYMCYITYQYMVKGKTYIKTGTLDTKNEYKLGSDVSVYYESKTPGNSTFSPDDYRFIGGIASSVICTLIIGLVVQYYVVSKVKGVGSLMIASRVARGNGIF